MWGLSRFSACFVARIVSAMNENTSGRIGVDLRERREAAGLSQLDVARRATCSPAMYGLLERGYRPHRSAVLERVVAALNQAEPPA